MASVLNLPPYIKLRYTRLTDTLPVMEDQQKAQEPEPVVFFDLTLGGKPAHPFLPSSFGSCLYEHGLSFVENICLYFVSCPSLSKIVLDLVYLYLPNTHDISRRAVGPSQDAAIQPHGPQNSRELPTALYRRAQESAGPADGLQELQVSPCCTFPPSNRPSPRLPWPGGSYDSS